LELRDGARSCTSVAVSPVTSASDAPTALLVIGEATAEHLGSRIYADVGGSHHRLIGAGKKNVNRRARSPPASIV